MTVSPTPNFKKTYPYPCTILPPPYFDFSDSPLRGRWLKFTSPYSNYAVWCSHSCKQIIESLNKFSKIDGVFYQNCIVAFVLSNKWMMLSHHLRGHNLIKEDDLNEMITKFKDNKNLSQEQLCCCTSRLYKWIILSS